MPRNHARKKALSEIKAERGVTHTEAIAILDAPRDPGDELLCATCGWTLAMICPECPGCGCYNGHCSGWRHQEYMCDDELREQAEDEACRECGAGGPGGNPYAECACYEYE